MRARGDDGTADIGRALRRSIAEWNGQPTFFFVNLCESHSPYLPPRPWNDLPSWERARAALDSHRYLSFEAICRYVGGALTVPDEALDRMRHLYRRAASYMDEWLAGVLEALDRKGILDDTLVIVTSDHGENFGEGGLLVHGFSVDQRLIHVPLVMAGPGAADPGRVFSLRELSRLIAEAADLESHPWDEDGDGPAVAEYDPLGEPDDPAWDEFCSRWSIDHAGRERLGSRYSCATDGRLKLVLRNDAELLYDIVDDPQETTPLDIDEADDAVPTLRDAAARSHATTGPAVSPSPAATPATASPEELEQLERQMKLLGYM
jgi:arylsulfatase A-like enzyme